MKNLAKLEQKLLEAARAEKPSDHVPYAFEKRVMAQIQAGLVKVGIDPLTLWNRWLWRVAAPCLGAVLFLSSRTPPTAQENQPIDIASAIEEVALTQVEENLRW